MKTSTILPTIFLLTGLLAFSSCRTTRDGTDHRHPNSGYPYPERRHYPDYPYDEYPVYRSMPPGQAKKIYGDKSARRYAPGQQKKYRYPNRHYPLIIIRTPDIVIYKYDDGRLYYRNPEGWTYWLAPDNRLYLDEKYIDKTTYPDEDYREWQSYYKKKDKEDWNDKREPKQPHWKKKQ